MASLRRYDVQAKVGLIVSCAAVLCVAGLVGLILRNFQRDLGIIVYSPKSMFGPAVFLMTAATFLLGGIGAALGANSAGQRRNEYSKRSWAAFFIGAASISLTIILFVAFWMYRVKLA